jgi:hypothetical protein
MRLLNVPLIAICCSLIPSIVSAQPNNPYGSSTKGQPKIEIDGKLQAWQGGMMRIVNSAGQSIAFALPQSPNAIRFTAPVELGALKKGMFVRIQAPVGPNGQFLEPVNSLTLFTPDRSRMTTPNDRSMNVPGIYRVRDLVKQIPGEMGSPDVRIVGTVVGVETNAIALQCGNKPMKIELSESPKIELTTSSLEFAKPGDGVRGSGYGNPATNQIAATNISIQSTKLITAPAPPAAVLGQEGMKLRIKEKAKSKSKTPGLTETPESVEKPEMKNAPEATDKPEASAEKPLSFENPEKKDTP